MTIKNANIIANGLTQNMFLVKLFPLFIRKTSTRQQLVYLKIKQTVYSCWRKNIHIIIDLFFNKLLVHKTIILGEIYFFRKIWI